MKKVAKERVSFDIKLFTTLQYLIKQSEVFHKMKYLNYI